MADWRAVTGLLLNALTWGLSWWPFRQLQLAGLHPLWVTAMMSGFALALLLCVRPAAWKPFAHQPGLWLLALAAGLTNVGFNWAVTEGDVVRVVLLFYLMPAWVVVLAWPLLGERPTPWALLRLGIALAGVVLVLATPDAAWPWPQQRSDWLALGGGLAFALTNIMLRRLHGSPAESGMLAMFAGGGILAAGAAMLGMHFALVPAPPVLQAGLIAGVCGVALVMLAGNLGLQYGASRLPANVASLVMLSEVVFATLSSTVLGASALTARIALGGALIVLAAMLSTWRSGESSRL